ncbi:MAG TPA: helix-turn-helix domain-containing protein [Pseudonocardia sp.]|nr:helix-turn-helix domain-containing protein [Pseudonocardia sp.]
MVEPADAEAWMATLAKTAGRQVARFRMERKLTAQQLSDELKGRLGFEMKRTVVGNLESGYRRTISLAELLALASVLGVPPLLLVVPVAVEAEFEVLPGTTLDSWRAARWISGEARLPAGTGDSLQRHLAMDWTWEALDLYRGHDDAVDRAEFARRQYQRALDDLVRIEDGGSAEEIAEEESRVRAAERETRTADTALQVMRRAIRDHKWPLPTLDGALARRIDDQEGGAGA